jgi:hypothetical protein
MKGQYYKLNQTYHLEPVLKSCTCPLKKIHRSNCFISIGTGSSEFGQKLRFGGRKGPLYYKKNPFWMPGNRVGEAGKHGKISRRGTCDVGMFHYLKGFIAGKIRLRRKNPVWLMKISGTSAGNLFRYW